MEEDISVLRCKLDQLERAKNAAKVTASQCRAALSAHRRIPVEIWKMVFSELCLSLYDYSFNIWYRSPFLGLPATVISQVCSHWNVTSKGMPSLWSTINVNLDVSAYNVAILLEAYLSRSKEIPLKVRIRSLDPADDSSTPLAMWRTLSKHLHRCRELVMSVKWNSLVEELPPFQDLTFPNLESYYEEDPTPEEDVWPWFREAIHRKAPKLNMVSATSLDPNIPFSQLTAWEIPKLESSDQLHDFYNSLKCCRNLKFLALSLLSEPNDLSEFDEQVELPFLRRFDVGVFGDNNGWLSNILGNLVMHSLETCHIRYIEWPLPSDLLIMAERSSISLKRVVLNSYLKIGSGLGEDPVLLNFLQAARIDPL